MHSVALFSGPRVRLSSTSQTWPRARIYGKVKKCFFPVAAFQCSCVHTYWLSNICAHWDVKVRIILSLSLLWAKCFVTTHLSNESSVILTHYLIKCSTGNVDIAYEWLKRYRSLSCEMISEGTVGSYVNRVRFTPTCPLAFMCLWYYYVLRQSYQERA